MVNILYFLGFIAWLVGVLGQCPPLGSTLPVATRFADNSIVKQTIEGISAKLNNSTGDLNSTAFSITMGTIKDDTPLLEFFNAPSVFNASGTHNLTTDTQFIVASVSKLFTAYGIKLLSDKIAPSDPITKFVPELLHLKGQPRERNAITLTDWKSITVAALLSHLSGISEDLGDSDLDNAPGNYTALGLPKLNITQQGIQCGDAFNPYQRPCTEADFLDNWGRKYPAYAPFTTPVYSNVGFAILGLAIERATGKSYSRFMQDAIFDPLSLRHTSVDKPCNLSSAFITEEMADGDLSEGFLASSGAIYSSSKDLYTLGRSILSNTLLSPVETRAWLKPRSFTSSTGTFVGEVWEIARGANLTRGDGHIVDVYTKGGNLDAYSSIIALVPDYDFVFALTSAGPDTDSGTVQALLSSVLENIIPSFDAANKAQARDFYAGTYNSGADSITLVVDEGPGLLVTRLTVGGVDDIVDAVGQVMGATGPGQTTLRLYPTDLANEKQRTWQGVYDILTPGEASQENELFFFADATCQTWAEATIFSYGLIPIDQFILTVDNNGKSLAVDARAWRTVMTRA